MSPDSHTSCLFFGHRPLCSPALAGPGEEDRAPGPDLHRLGTWRGTAAVRAVPRPGPVVNRLLRPLGDSIVVSASSSEMPDPAARPQAAADADLGSAWLAGTSDTTPTLTLRWQHGRTVAGLQLLSDAALAASRATRVRVTFGDGTSVTAPVGADGRVRFPAVTTTMLRLTVLATDRRRTVDPVTSYASVLPFGVSEVSVDGADDLRRPVDAGAPTALPCGFGPPVTLDGREIPTRVRRDAGRPARAPADARDPVHGSGLDGAGALGRDPPHRDDPQPGCRPVDRHPAARDGSHEVRRVGVASGHELDGHASRPRRRRGSPADSGPSRGERQPRVACRPWAATT